MKVLLPIDGSEAALAAVHHALRLVRSGLRAEFVLANVQAPASLYEVVVAHDPAVIEEVSAAAAAELLEPAQALLRTAGVEFETEVASGDAGHAIVDIAERFGCEWIVMGARGIGAPLRASSLGAVANAVVHASTVPVTIVRADD